MSRNLRCIGEKWGKLEEQHSSQREQPAELPRGSIMLAVGFKEHQGGHCSHSVVSYLTSSSPHDHLEGRPHTNPLSLDKHAMPPEVKWLVLSH